MKAIPTSFRKGGFDFIQILREGDWAIFKKIRTALWKPHLAHYEVVRIRSHDGFTLAGKTFPPAETYPSSEKWGVDGFTCATLARAQEKLAECVHQHAGKGMQT